MRRLAFLLIIVVATSTVNAQLLKYGARVGINSSDLKLKDFANITPQDGGVNVEIKFKPNKPFGMHFGGFAQVAIAGFFFQPELLFVTAKSDIEVDNGISEVTRNVRQQEWNFDIPLFAGWKFGPARVGLGPVASFNLISKNELADFMNEISEKKSEEVVLKKAVWGLQFGAGVNLWKLIFDVKYELGLSKINDGAVNINGKNYNFSQKANQLIISAGYCF